MNVCACADWNVASSSTAAKLSAPLAVRRLILEMLGCSVLVIVSSSFLHRRSWPSGFTSAGVQTILNTQTGSASHKSSVRKALTLSVSADRASTPRFSQVTRSGGITLFENRLNRSVSGKGDMASTEIWFARTCLARAAQTQPCPVWINALASDVSRGFHWTYPSPERFVQSNMPRRQVFVAASPGE